MQSFRIWYGDGSAADGETAGEWAALPSSGVQIVHVTEGFDGHGRRLGRWFSGSDHYWHDGERIDASGLSAPVPGEWAENTAPAGAIVKTGEWIAEDILRDIFAAAGAWVDG